MRGLSRDDQLCCLVLVGEHDREDSNGLGIGRVFCARGQAGIGVGVDLPEDALTGVLEAAEVVFSVRIVFGREGIEVHNQLADSDLVVGRQGGNACRHDAMASAGKAPAEAIVKLRDLRSRGGKGAH